MTTETTRRCDDCGQYRAAKYFRLYVNRYGGTHCRRCIWCQAGRGHGMTLEPQTYETATDELTTFAVCWPDCVEVGRPAILRAVAVLENLLVGVFPAVCSDLVGGIRDWRATGSVTRLSGSLAQLRGRDEGAA